MGKIIESEIENFEKCNNIWNMNKDVEHKNIIYNDLVSGSRKKLFTLRIMNILTKFHLFLIKMMKIILFLMFEYIFLELL